MRRLSRDDNQQNTAQVINSPGIGTRRC